ncbi:hypothetical protein A3H03_03730 [Candidatus Kuenenbacteria bacterium RIFCSPLOWO2_12_FULL_42_13]|uniref:TVP38/TMEM64 family membrane protein n=1 Tax=Candidatus Kuenenbacteria bacterium RIFCSPLOWO2_12_FULL_42_13 TaxID=1798565 RepID=A0A1F6G1P1_9BACT|nr:MAG: hypothetical protein A3H03_03730 [Candidatus Kuenenbacteria bacterium RIFCSPLOWO2_12_FULL_42_13]
MLKRKIKYPKFSLLLITYILTAFIFGGFLNEEMENSILDLHYLGAFIAGVMFTYSFTAGVATAVFLIIGQGNNLIAFGLIGGLGALMGDLVIFKVLRGYFKEEIDKLGQEKIIKALGQNARTAAVLKHYVLPILGAIIIASPLPDELGVSLFAMDKVIKPKFFSVMSYLLNTAGIFVILFIGR